MHVSVCVCACDVCDNVYGVCVYEVGIGREEHVHV